MKRLKTLVASALLCVATGAHADINFSWSKNVGPLNPHQTSPNQAYAQGMVYEPLVRYAHSGKVIPWLAKSWQILDNGTRYRFSLREDVKFSNGEQFNAYAAKANFDQLLKNYERHRWLETIAQLKSVEVVDEFTVDLTLKTPYYAVLQELSLVRPIRFMAPSAMPESGHTGQGIEAPIGTGPWMLQETVLGVKDVFIRNPHYWGDKPKSDKVTIDVISDSNARVLAFEGRMINLIYGKEGQISPDAFQRFSQRDDVNTALSAPYATRLIAMNSAKSATQERDVRIALNHALNRNAISSGIFYGTESPAHTLFAPNIPYSDLNLPEYSYDQGRARSLLQGAGWKPGKDGVYREKAGRLLSLDLVYHGNDANQKAIAEVMQANFKQVGVKLNLVAEEESRFYKRQKLGEFDLIFNNTWGTPYDPHTFMSGMRRAGHADYMAQSGLPMKGEIDRQISALLASGDETQRQDHYRYVLSTLHSEAVYLPLTYMRSHSVSRKELGSFKMGAAVFDIPFEQMGR